ncbi:uncharacterized protein LOC142631280 isoform X2 [Castanea sativa]|uniref:uncharacterized protein LOC142631280 isoform X2 n=1 Tax=Castanea sativa TaxID=21020 RepID=UPI003F64D8E1
MYCSSSSSIFTTPSPSPSPSPRSSNFSFFPFPQFALQIPNLQTLRLSLTLCNAAPKPQTGPNSKTKTKTKTKKKKKSNNKGLDFSNVEVVNDDDDDDNGEGVLGLNDAPLPKPPAGFVVDDNGRLVMASSPSKRITTIVDPMNNLPLECVIRRVFRSSQGDECMLLCPVDTPVQILKSTNIDGWSAVNDEEVEAILPSAAYALSKIHMHLVHSGFCYTARGGFCYSEDDIFDFRTDDGQDVDGLPTEGVEITFFHLDGSQYMIYTPSDPLLFVVVKNHTGVLQIADDFTIQKREGSWVF